MCNKDLCDDHVCPEKKKCFFESVDNNGDPCAVPLRCVRLRECDKCWYDEVCVIGRNSEDRIFGRCGSPGRKSDGNIIGRESHK